MDSLRHVVGLPAQWFIGAAVLAALGAGLIHVGGATSWAELWLLGFPLLFGGIIVAGGAMVWALLRAIRAYNASRKSS